MYFWLLGLHLLSAGSLFGSIFAPLLPQWSSLYNPLPYHTRQYIVDQDWHALALRSVMAHQRLHRPDQVNLEDLRKSRSISGSPDGSTKDDGRRNIDNDELRDTDSPDGSIEVDDKNDSDKKIVVESDDSQESLRVSSTRSLDHDDSKDEFIDDENRLRPSIENLNDIDGDNDDQVSCCNDLNVKIRIEGTVDLTTKREQDKENVGQDLTTTRRKDDDIDVARPHSLDKSKSPKPRHVWRPY